MNIGYHFGTFAIAFVAGYLFLGLLWLIPPLRRKKGVWYSAAVVLAALLGFVSTEGYAIGHFIGVAVFAVIAWWRLRSAGSEDEKSPATKAKGIITKRSMRLNGWQRIGVVLSVVWAIGAGIHQRQEDLGNAAEFSALMYRFCTDAKDARNDPNLMPCAKEQHDQYEMRLVGSWPNVAFVSFVPIPLTWLAVYLLIRLWRWVKAGFKP